MFGMTCPSSSIETSTSEARFGTVIGIQVFQHGTEPEAHAHVRAAISLLLPDGLLCIRVNAVGTEIEHRHKIIVANDQGGFTVIYDDGRRRASAFTSSRATRSDQRPASAFRASATAIDADLFAFSP
jgi:hypothetical protein